MSDFASVYIQAFLKLWFFFLKKGCENKYNYHTAQQLMIIEKKESWAGFSGDIEKMINKSFLGGYASSHSTSSLTTGISLPHLDRHIIQTGGANTTLPALRAQPVVTPIPHLEGQVALGRLLHTMELTPAHMPTIRQDTCRLLFSHPLRYTLS